MAIGTPVDLLVGYRKHNFLIEVKRPGEKVRIRTGPFSDFIGTVEEIDIERAKVKVLVSFFGRETPVELDFLHVENV